MWKKHSIYGTNDQSWISEKGHVCIPCIIKMVSILKGDFPRDMAFICHRQTSSETQKHRTLFHFQLYFTMNQFLGVHTGQKSIGLLFICFIFRNNFHTMLCDKKVPPRHWLKSKKKTTFTFMNVNLRPSVKKSNYANHNSSVIC